ncbi:MAG: hypothetical protein NTY05_02390 [Rhodocyclales bacterium]|nr:hypothetical protein [Rhodocyclales bacterium]
MNAAAVPRNFLAMSIRHFVLLATLAMLAGAGRADEDIEWRHRVMQGAVTLSANPMGIAARTAFYSARGFAAETIRPYAQACGFSLSLQNGGAVALSTRLADWHAIGADGRPVRLRLPSEWDIQWARAQVPEAARIAFRWAQFQAENIFEPGDWIMGMATLEAPLPDGFRLIARYHDEKGDHEIVLDQLACSRDSVGN